MGFTCSTRWQVLQVTLTDPISANLGVYPTQAQHWGGVFGVFSLELQLICVPLPLTQTKVIIQAAYGSQRHLSVYKELGMQKDQIFIHGKRNMKRPSEHCLVRS